MSEKEIEKLLKDKIREAGGKSYKFVSPGITGVPDRIVIFPLGLVGFVEVKALGKKPRPDQEHQIKKLINLGCQVFVLDKPDQIPGIIRQIKRQGERP